MPKTRTFSAVELVLETGEGVEESALFHENGNVELFSDCYLIKGSLTIHHKYLPQIKEMHKKLVTQLKRAEKQIDSVELYAPIRACNAVVGVSNAFGYTCFSLDVNYVNYSEMVLSTLNALIKESKKVYGETE